MRFVPVKTKSQQDTLCLHRVRERIIASRTAITNETRGLLLEYGIAIPKGLSKLRKTLPEILESISEVLSTEAKMLFSNLYEEIKSCDEEVKFYENKIQALAKASAPCRKIMKIPGVGPITASAIVATIGDPRSFSNGRQVAAWLGLVPRQNSSGGKEKLGGISKRGDNYLRKLLIHGARSVVKGVEKQLPSKRTDWLKQLLERRGHNRTCVALANKNARVIWRLLATEDDYKVA